MIKILFLADTHLGFDYTFKPRVIRRRRGVDFFRNFERALEPAYQGEVDLVCHGGDIFYRSKVPARLVDMAFEPLHKIAEKGIPVYIVPGNHERSMIPFRVLAAHPHIFLFEKPMCYSVEIRGHRCVLAGFPFIRDGIREKFKQILHKTGWHDMRAATYILCMHQSVDGCTMGPRNYTFRGGADVVDIHDIPQEFCCVLSGHMHRWQVLDRDLAGVSCATPVLYPGSIERTSFAERDEKKGYLILQVPTDDKGIGRQFHWQFNELPVRPMVQLEYDAAIKNTTRFEIWLRERMSRIPEDSIVKIRIRGEPSPEVLTTIRAGRLRSIAPMTMNVSVTLPVELFRGQSRR